ncbi:MAG: hypothetical protein KF901_07280 [Myxococcales bacterium]|nr:hypothetical protein [Myxococcales bacterium]
MVALLLLDVLPSDPLGLGRFTWFPVLLTLALYAPRVARRASTALGVLGAEGRHLSLHTPFGRRDLGVVAGVHVSAGERGASLLFSMEDDALVAAEVDDAGVAQGFAEAIRRRGATRVVALPRAGFVRMMTILRFVGALFALGYYLHTVHHLIGGHKAFYGLTALGCGVLLLIAHVVRHRKRAVVSQAGIHLDGHPRPFGGETRFVATRGDVLLITGQAREHLDLGELPPAMRHHVAAHFSAARRPLPEPQEVERERADALLARLHAELAEGDDAYRGTQAAARSRIEGLVHEDSRPLTERALALRALRASDPSSCPPAALREAVGADVVFVERVAGAASDAAALALVERRRPVFVA